MALPTVAIRLPTAAPVTVPVTPKTEANTAADTDASVLAHTWVPEMSSRDAPDPDPDSDSASDGSDRSGGSGGPARPGERVGASGGRDLPDAPDGASGISMSMSAPLSTGDDTPYWIGGATGDANVVDVTSGAVPVPPAALTCRARRR